VRAFALTLLVVACGSAEPISPAREMATDSGASDTEPEPIEMPPGWDAELGEACLEATDCQRLVDAMTSLFPYTQEDGRVTGTTVWVTGCSFPGPGDSKACSFGCSFESSPTEIDPQLEQLCHQAGGSCVDAEDICGPLGRQCAAGIVCVR
jgi:hypothetical protein